MHLDTPDYTWAGAGVAVSEAVRIAKKYNDDDTGAFVNGILGSFVRNLAPVEGAKQ